VRTVASVVPSARVALPCNYQVGLSLTGKLFACGIRFVDEAPAFELHVQGKRKPQVLSSNELAVSPPYGRTILAAARAWRVHTADEIAFDAPLIDRGLYDPTATYRTGNYVTLPDKSKWLYIATLTSSGNAPPTWPQTENAWWSNMEPPVGAGDIKYGDGSTVEDMKPAQPGADVTEDNVSKDTANVGGRPVDQLLADLQKLNIDAAAALAQAADLTSRANQIVLELEGAKAAILANGQNITVINTTLGQQGAMIEETRLIADNTVGQLAEYAIQLTAANTTANQALSASQTNAGQLATFETSLATTDATANQALTVAQTAQGVVSQFALDLQTTNANVSLNAQAISLANGSLASLTTQVQTAQAQASQTRKGGKLTVDPKLRGPLDFVEYVWTGSDGYQHGVTQQPAFDHPDVTKVLVRAIGATDLPEAWSNEVTA
jgi:hypothetical protein